MAQNTNSTKPREVTRLATIERRGGAEQLRLSLDEFSPQDVEPSRYVSARKWCLTRDGRWQPTKSGLTIRASELAAVIEALQHALSALGEDEAA